MRDVTALTEMIISVLMDRRGFDEWFNNIPDSIVDDIIDEIDETIQNWLNTDNNYEMDEDEE